MDEHYRANRVFYSQKQHYVSLKKGQINNENYSITELFKYPAFRKSLLRSDHDITDSRSVVI